MADDRPVTLSVLAKFHREVIRPDIERIVSDTVDGAERRLRDEMHSIFDGLAQRLDRLEIEYQLLVVGLKRVEKRLDRVDGRLDAVEGQLEKLDLRLGRVENGLDRVEKRLDDVVSLQEKLALRSHLEDLKARVEGLQAQIKAIEQRLDA